MAEGYSWSDMRDGATYRLPGPEHLGGWAAVAMLVSILLHVAVFLLLDRMNVALRFEQARVLGTESIRVSQVEVRPQETDWLPPEETIKPPADTASLIEEIDLLAALPKDLEIDIRPDVLEAEYALQFAAPAAEGDPQAEALEIASNFEIEADLPELGRQPEDFKPAAVGQITVDPGAVPMEDDALDKLTDELIKRGAGGKVEQGALDGIASLDDLLGLAPNVLLSKKTLLPSDLLFEFNSFELRESAKIGLMKLGLLMDQNPDLYCWIEGHTDLVGGDEFNLNLSIRRAEAVKRHLVESLRMNPEKIITRGFGRYEPLVIEGDVEAQAINRRVEIRMRQTPPTREQMKVAPRRATVIEETPPTVPQPPPPVEAPAPPRATPAPDAATEEPDPSPPRAVLVRPARALPVEEVEPAEPEDFLPPLPDVPRARPVELEAPRADPVED